VTPSFAMHVFQGRLLAILYFFPILQNELKATVLAWCLNNDSVTHKYLAEMKGWARDEIPFLSVM
jgi:hypothetical protein